MAINVLKSISIVILALVVTACGREEVLTLRIGTNVWPGYEPLYLARKLEEWPADRIRLVEYPSSSEVLRAFRNRSLEAASLTLDEVLILRQDNIPVKVVLIHDISNGADVILAHKGIPNMQDLRGKRVGVEYNALGAFLLTRALELNGLTLDDVEVVPTPANNHQRTFLDGTVDAIVTFEPARTALLNAGAAEIFTSRELPNEIVDVLVVHEDYLHRRPENIRQVIDGWFRAVDFMQSNPEHAAHILAERLKIAPQEVMASYDGLRIPPRSENGRLLSGRDAGLIATITHTNRILVDNQLIDSPVDVSHLLSARFVDGEQE